MDCIPRVCRECFGEIGSLVRSEAESLSLRTDKLKVRVHGVFGEGIAHTIANEDEMDLENGDSPWWKASNFLTERRCRKALSIPSQQEKTDAQAAFPRKEWEDSVRNSVHPGYRQDEGVSKNDVY